MAAETKRGAKHAAADSVRINFRLNPNRPKERVIMEFLREHAQNYDASRIIKQALYEVATGCSWITGQPLQPVAVSEPVREVPTKPDQRQQLLSDIMAGLDEWMTQ